MSPILDWFSTYDSTGSWVVLMRNNASWKIADKGTGVIGTLTDVRDLQDSKKKSRARILWEKSRSRNSELNATQMQYIHSHIMTLQYIIETFKTFPKLRARIYLWSWGRWEVRLGRDFQIGKIPFQHFHYLWHRWSDFWIHLYAP